MKNFVKKQTIVSQPVSIVHQGKAIFFVERENAATKERSYYYNVLDPQVTNPGLDSDDWEGYRLVNFPQEESLAGFNILRTPMETRVYDPYFSLVSDEKHIYFFRSAFGSIYVSRFLLAQTADKDSGLSSFILAPVWEVRYQRSEKPDSPAGESDAQGFLNMDQEPFLEPQYILPLGSTAGALTLSEGHFCVQLIPVAQSGQYRWQFFTVNAADNRLYTYSFAQLRNGWFNFGHHQLNQDYYVILPDHRIALQPKEGEAYQFVGPPVAALYNKQEEQQLQDDTGLKMKNAYRLKLLVEIAFTAEQHKLASFDFGIGTGGFLAFLAQDEAAADLAFTPGLSTPQPYSLQFDRSFVSIPSDTEKIELQQSFVQQCWVFAEDNTLSPNYIFGSLNTDTAQQPPSLWIEDGTRIAFGFGDGNAFIKGISQTSAIQRRRWNNIIAAFDGNAYQLYVNGRTVPILNNESFQGKKPVASPIDTLGAGGGKSAPTYFMGALDELRIWNSVEALPQALHYLFQEIPLDMIGEMKDLLAYWRFDEGSGLSTKNLSTKGDALNGSLQGASWQTNYPPIQRTDSESLYIEEKTLLNLKVGLLDGSATAFSNFGQIKTGSRPTLHFGADGLLRLYYEGTDTSFYVAQFNTTESRATFSTSWQAKASNASANESGSLYFLARQSGQYLNQASIQLSEGATPYLCTLSFNNQFGYTETWKNIPRRVESLIPILQGRSSIEAAKLDNHEGYAFFDYSGQHRIAYQSYGLPEQHGQLIFLNEKNVVLQLEELSNVITDGLASTSFHFKQPDSDEIIVATIKNIPLAGDRYVQTLQGLNPDYNYDDPDNFSITGATMHVLHTNRGYTLFFVPPSVSFIANYRQTWQAPTAQLSLHFNDQEIAHQVAWDGKQLLSGNLKSFVHAATPDRHLAATTAVSFVTRYSPAVQESSSEQIGMEGILKLFQVFLEGGSGDVTEFTLKPTLLQGAITGQDSTISSSKLFYALSSNKAQNGFPEMLLSDSKTGKITLQVVGEAGGWTAETRRSSVAITDRSYLTAPISETAIAGLDIRGDLTTECWFKPTFGKETMDAADPMYSPRLIHANIQPTQDGGTYLMGIIPSYSLQMLIETSLRTSDEGIADETKRLFPTGAYTVQFYLKLNLETITDGVDNFVLRLQSTEDSQNQAALLVDKTGLLRYVVQQGETSQELKSEVALRHEQWTWISLVCDGSSSYLYQNTQVVGSIPLLFKSKNSSLRFSDNIPEVDLEFELNQASIWNRPLSAQEITYRYKQAIPSDANGLILLWGLNQFREDMQIENSALSTFGDYHSSVDKAFWDFPGIFYRAFSANRDLAMISREALIAEESWNHLASVYYMDYGMESGGEKKSYANCGNDRSLDVSDAFSIEAWLFQDHQESNSRQVIFSKMGADLANQSYELGLDQNNKVYLSLRLDGGEENESNNHIRFSAGDALSVQQPHFLAVSVNIQQKVNENDQQNPKQDTELSVQFVIDGVVQAVQTRSFQDPVNVSASRASCAIGRTQLDGNEADAAYFQGVLSNISFWKNGLSAAEMRNHYQDRIKFTDNEEGLISVWYFREQEGRIAADAQAINDARLSYSGAWTVYPHSANIQLYINGQASVAETTSVYKLGGYANSQFKIGAMGTETDKLTHQFEGPIDEMRIWKGVRTYEQINDSLYTTVGTREKNLAAYWQFDAASGTIVADRTGRGNHLHFAGSNAAPQWIFSDVPVNNEAPQVTNVLGGTATAYHQQIQNGPAIIEYADTQYDYYGNLFSVLKRGYIYLNRQGTIQQITGFKIGNLEQVYVGQVQSDPTIIGYIEGAPPLPSENLTRPFYDSPTSPAYFGYNNKSSVKLSESENLQISYSENEESGHAYAIAVKAGLRLENKVDKNIGVPPVQIITSVVRVAGKLGLSYSYQFGFSEQKQQQQVSRLQKSSSHQVYNCGDWERPIDGKYYLRTGERMYNPNNDGIAFVKSATADVYALYLARNNALVGMVTVPNPHIPVDINYIYFPIEPTYTRNGTLDGRLGLQDDFICKRKKNQGSYFRPIEAYALKNRIAREQQQLEAHYQQFDAIKKGQQRTGDIDDVKKKNLFHSASEGFKRDIVNTYLWTAAGGLYSEANGYASIVQESFSGKFSDAHKPGIYGSLGINTPFGGIDFEADFSSTISWTRNVFKSREENAQISLQVSADPEGYLNKYVGSKESAPYKDYPEPGKVDSYRFMSYYLGADDRNVEDLFSTVIDSHWLNNSQDPNAVALREASANRRSKAWRILHRTTYVSRIMPSFQLYPDDTTASSLAPPVNLESNEWLISAVQEYIDKQAASVNLSDEQIGDAVRDVVMNELLHVIPWWDNYLKAAQQYNSEAFKNLQSLLTDTIAYMQCYYSTL